MAAYEKAEKEAEELRKRQAEELRLRKLKQEQDLLKEQQRIRLQQEQEERLRLQKEQEERLRLQKEQQERLRLQKEKEERLQKELRKQQEQERICKQAKQQKIQQLQKLRGVWNATCLRLTLLIQELEQEDKRMRNAGIDAYIGSMQDGQMENLMRMRAINALERSQHQSSLDEAAAEVEDLDRRIATLSE